MQYFHMSRSMDGQSHGPKPMFVLPPGKNVQVNIQKNEIIKSKGIEAINVTTETKE